MYKYNSFHSQLELPFLETNENHLKEIFNLLETKFGLIKGSKQKLVDLGAGIGTVVIFSALNYGIKSIGIEINALLIQEAKDRIKSLKKEKKYNRRYFNKVKLNLADFYQQDLKEYNFIYLYCLPTMHKYLKHVLLTAKKGAIVISYKYPFEIFEKSLEIQEKIKHKEENQEISTFFYQIK